jgi:hypothetical protein
VALESERTGYEQVIDKFIFDDESSIKIPKSVRKKAFDLSVDIKIISIAREDYKNYRVLPPTSFFGHVVLVMEDFTEIHIKIEQPRQRLYYYRIREAFEQWHAYLVADYLGRVIKQTQNLICTVSGILGAPCAEVPCEAPPEFRFVEVPIREVYVRCPYGTLFELEVAYTKPLLFTNLCGGTFSPDSGIPDGAKDGGLPANGIQPAIANNPDSPFAGQPSPSSPAELGEYYNHGKEDTVERVDPTNVAVVPDPPGTVYWVKVIGRQKRPGFPSGCANQRTETFHYARTKDQVVESVRAGTPFSTGCGADTSSAYYLTLTGSAEFDLGQNDGGAHTITLEKGMSQPANTITFAL